MPPTDQYLLGEMNAKLDTLISRANEDRERIEKLAKRVSDLEAFRWKLVGAASVISTTLGALAGTITSRLFGSH